MSQRYTNSHHNSPFPHTVSDLFGFSGSSVLDNIGTFRHFSRCSPTNPQDKKDFYTLYYRRKNLVLKFKLENSSYSSHDHIQKISKSLACCSSHSEVKEFQDTEAHITKTSKKCKSRYCLICSRIESNKNTVKFIEKATSSEHSDFFTNRRFYFLTLTLKHNNETRNDNYIKELRSYISKLTRSKLFKDTFIQSSDKNNYGAIQSIEMTMSADSYHIHSHILICCHPLKSLVSKIENDLRSLWYRISGDSDQVRLDLIKTVPKFVDPDFADEDNTKLIKAVSEVFKYVVKSESLTKMNQDQTDKMCEWIIDTKGKNFINALGYFRKLGLVRRVKNSDLPEMDPVDKPIKEVLLTKTISIEANANLSRNYSKAARRDVLKYFKITGIVDTYHIATDIKDSIDSIFKTSKGTEINDTFLSYELNDIRRKEAHWLTFQNEDHFGDYMNHKAASSMNVQNDNECPF